MPCSPSGHGFVCSQLHILFDDVSILGLGAISMQGWLCSSHGDTVGEAPAGWGERGEGSGSRHLPHYSALERLGDYRDRWAEK